MSVESKPEPGGAEDGLRRVELQILDLAARVDRCCHDLEVQFTRMAQLQADIDLIRRAWDRVEPPQDPRRP